MITFLVYFVLSQNLQKWQHWDCIHITDLGILIGNFDSGKAIFLPLWFYVKSILADFRRSKLPFSQFWRLWIVILWKKFIPQNDKIFQKFKIQSCSNGQNSSFWGFKMTKLVSRKIWVAEKIMKFPHCAFPIRLHRCVNWHLESQLLLYI